jgi:hypothetical protein
MHEILIYFVIIAIVAAQVAVAVSAYRKIDLYKEIIPEAQNFKTVKVYIRESQVKDIKIDYILSNLNKFQEPEGVEEEVLEAEIIHSPETVIENDFREEEEVIGYEDLIWVAKGNEEKKIKYKLLTSYQQQGWSKI